MCIQVKDVISPGPHQELGLYEEGEQGSTSQASVEKRRKGLSAWEKAKGMSILARLGKVESQIYRVRGR